MSKLADALQRMRIVNNYRLTREFGSGSGAWCDYVSREPGSFGGYGSFVHGYGKPVQGVSKRKRFGGNRAESMPRALAWATEQYGITKWAPSPFGGKIPADVRKRAEAAVKAASKAVTS